MRIVLRLVAFDGKTKCIVCTNTGQNWAFVSVVCGRLLGEFDQVNVNGVAPFRRLNRRLCFGAVGSLSRFAAGAKREVRERRSHESGKCSIMCAKLY